MRMLAKNFVRLALLFALPYLPIAMIDWGNDGRIV